jgi:glutamyl-tRNA synthetase
LGWTPADATKEIMPDDELIAAFNLENISHSDAVFDRAKLDWFNTEYIRRYPAEKLLPLVREEWLSAGLKPRTDDETWLLAAIDLLKPRARSLKDFAGVFRAYFSDDYETDPAALEKFLRDAATRAIVAELGERYGAANQFTEQSAEEVLRGFAAEKNVKAGVLINGARVALTGQAVAPSLFAVMALLGKEITVRRLKSAVN